MTTKARMWITMAGAGTAALAIGQTLLAGEPVAAIEPMVYEGEASVVSEFILDVFVGKCLTLQTTALSKGGDPVLHLLCLEGTELAVDDNSAGGQAAHLRWTPAADGKVRVVIRARTGDSAGTCDLVKDGRRWKAGVRFGGWGLRLQNLRATEEIESIRLPNGAGKTHVLYVLKGDGLGIALRQEGGGTAGGARVAGACVVGSRWITVAVGQEATSGRIRLLRNDVNLPGHDPDGDGLGAELEAALGTCSRLGEVVGGFDTSLAVDPRDTDGDGVSDGWEVLGRRDVEPHQPLPLWGADPRHKDLFIEVDFMRRTEQENRQQVELRMPAAVARRFADVYGDRFTTDPDLRRLHAAMLRSPDGEPGIRVHLDTGRNPESPQDATIYGDWGGYTAVDAEKTADGKFRGVHRQTAWRTHLSPARVGIFRYALAYTTGGGQSGWEFAASYNMNSAYNAIHETGHTMGLGHSGPMGLSYVDVNGKPNYPSVMNYAFGSEVGFSDGRDDFPPLNNWALTEWRAADPSNGLFLDILQQKFKYWVDRTQGHVDWNRDGLFAPEGTTVRAYANLRPGVGCEYTRYNQVQIAGALSRKSPAMARLDKRLYLFYSDEGALKYVSSSSSWNCPKPLVPPQTAGTWGAGHDAEMDAGGGVDVVRIPGLGACGEQLLVVTIDGGGRLWERRLTVSGGQEKWGALKSIPATRRAMDEPSLVRMDGGRSVLLAYKGAGGALRLNRLVGGRNWKADGPARTREGEVIELGAGVSPGLVQANKTVFGAFADRQGSLVLYRYHPRTRRWEATDMLEGRRPLIRGRPAMAWVPYSAATQYPGRLCLVFTDRSTPVEKKYMLRMMMSYVKVSKTPDGRLEKKELVGLFSPFDNVWLHAYGVDLLYEPGLDTNLRAAFSRTASRRGDGAVYFRPNADGINDFTYRNANDWDVLRIGLCGGVVNPGGLVPNPIKCPEKTW